MRALRARNKLVWVVYVQYGSLHCALLQLLFRTGVSYLFKRTGACGKNVVWTVFPVATQRFVREKLESSQVSRRPAFRLRSLSL
jgi:hypothetical protein